MSAKAVQDDWAAGKDFMILSFGPDSGRYINRPQAPEGVTIMVRYSRMTRITTVS